VNTDNGLLGGITAQAQKKAEKIIQNAQVRSDQIIADAVEKSKHDVMLEEKSYTGRVATEGLKLEASKRSIARKVQLEILNRRYTQLLENVREKVLSTLQGKEGEAVLCSWILEAVLGLGLDKAKISFCISTPVNEEMLRKVEKMALDKYDLTIALQLDSRRLLAPGVVATSLNGKISFNNQVDVRMRRFDRDLKVAVQEGSCPQE
jgi:V/A-type H+-transporting ATPase subunit E